MALSLWTLALLAIIGLLAAEVDSITISPCLDPVQHQTVASLLDSRITLTYSRTRICETTPGVQSYSGYVNLPANTTEGRPYDIHTFFWFFEARKHATSAPLSLWLQGGPGAPSTPSAVGETGPCFVARNSRDTTLNPWSLNNEVNLLYIDQPVQAGYSYDRLINGTIDETLLPYVVSPLPQGAPAPVLNSTFLFGTFSSQDPMSTPNMTSTAALAAWHFMQIWMKQFPKYKPYDNKISIWGESYGGHYGPTFANFFAEQSKNIAYGSRSNTVIPLQIGTVGIINGCIDILTQMQSYPQMAYNNTYGIQVISEAEYNDAMDSFPACRSLVEACRSLADTKDPTGVGNVEEVNTACSDAYNFCFAKMWEGVESRGRNVFDITALMPHSFPPKYAGGFLNSEGVQRELGVPLNITGISTAVFSAFMSTGDFVLGKNLEILGKLLDQGVKVALVYGDRDYQCNWYGGEQISLAIQSKFSTKFHEAGYTEIQTNKTYVGGYVRQHGNLSFSRVLQAGHEAPWYQPETTYQIFNRVMFDKDVATGQKSTARGGYSTNGPDNVFDITNAIPSHPVSECYLWDIFQTCTELQTDLLRNGTAILEDFIMIGHHTADGTTYYYEGR